MSVASPPLRGPTLLGREVEIDRIDALLGELRQRGGALLLSGEPGIGKSALLDRARERAGELGARILGAVGVESEAQFPFAALHQLLTPLSRRMASLSAPQRQALQAAFGISEETELDPFRVAFAAFQLVCDGADSSPLLLIVDDAQWIDRSSLDVLTFIARRLENEPVAVLVAARDGSTTALGDFGLPIVHLERLDDVAAVELLDRTAPELGDALRSRVLQEAAGNPLGLVELARVAVDGVDALELPSAAPLTLTARLESAFAATLDGLSEPTRLTLLAAALDPNASLVEVLAAAICIHDDGPVEVSALDSAIATGFVAVVDKRVRFSHPLIRSAVRQTATQQRVLSMFGALAEVVVDPDRQLWHRAMATLGRDEEIAEALELYAVAARHRGALTVAASALQRASELSADHQKRSDRLIRAAEIAYDLGLVDTVRSLIRKAEPLDLGTLETARLQWLQQMVAGDVWFETRATKTFVTIARQMRVGGDPDMALRSLAPIAHRCWWTQVRSRTRQYVVETAEEVGVPDGDPRLLAVIALAHPEATGRSVLHRIAGMDFHELADPVAAMFVGIAAEKAGDFAGGARFLARAVEHLREQGRLGLLTQALVHYAWAATHIGDWGAAAAAGVEAAGLARDSRQLQYGLTGELVAALATAQRGNEPNLEAMIVKPEQALLAMGGGPMLAPAHLARAAAALGDGRHDVAFDHLWPVFDQHSPAFHRFMRWPALLDLVEAGTRSERTEQLTDVIAELEAVAARSHAPILRVGLACAKPLMATDEQPETLYMTALDQDLTAHPFLRSRTLFSLGCWLRRRRRSVDSRGPLREAINLFDALGATRWSTRARQELRATGEQLGRRTPDARDRLTAQELQIARLAAEGLSNREIGQRLFLSHRTIGSHLYRIFPKLEIAARAQLRDALAAAGTHGEQSDDSSEIEAPARGSVLPISN